MSLGSSGLSSSVDLQVHLKSSKLLLRHVRPTTGSLARRQELQRREDLDDQSDRDDTPFESVFVTSIALASDAPQLPGR